MRKTVALAALFAATLIAHAPSASAEDELVIGGGLVISGPSASYGTDAAAGMDVAVAEINERGGVLGRKIRIEYEDSAGDPARGVAIYRKFAAQPDIVAAMSVTSMEFVALNPVTETEKLPLVSIGSTIPMESFSPYTFRTNLILDKSISSVLSKLKENGTKSIAILYDNSLNYAVSEMETVRKNVEDAGIELAAVESFSGGEQNLTLQLTQIVQSKPDTIWVAGMTEGASMAISQARGMGIDAKFIGGAGMNDPRIAEVGDAARGAMTYALFNVNDDRSAVQAFVKRFKEMNGHAPSAYNALGYDAMMIVANALERAGKVDRETLREALSQTAEYAGVNGPFTYVGSGDNQSQSPQLLVLGVEGFAPLR